MLSSIYQRAHKIKVSDFVLLDELGRLGSIREAARSFRTTPAQVSRRLKVIEKAFGYRIFERGVKGLTLTGHGSELMKSVVAINGELHKVIGARKRERLEVDRPIGLASTSFLTTYAIIPVLQEMMIQFPHIRSYIQAFNPDDLIYGGVKGAFHIALHPGAMDWPRSWQSSLIGFTRWGLFVREGHPLIKSTKNIDEVPFVYPLLWDGGKLVVQNDNCPLPVNMRNSYVGTQTAEQAMHLVQQSNLAGYLPELMMRGPPKKAVEIRMPSWPSFEQPVYLSVRTDSVANGYFNALESHLKKLLKIIA